MAVPAETLRTFEDNTLKESVRDVIYDTSPEDTPLMSTVTQTTVGNHLHQWPIDALDTPSSTNANLEGEDFVGTPANKPTRLDNNTQISKKEPVVSGSDQAFEGYGRGGMIEYQEVKKGVALKTDVEMSMFRNGAKVQAADAVAGVSGGIETYLVSNVQGGPTAVEATGNGVDARTPGTLRDFDETLFTTALENAFNEGAKIDQVFMNAKKKTISGGFTGYATNKDLDVGTRRIIAAVSVYETDFGPDIAMTPSRHVNTTSVIGITNSFIELGTAPGRNMVSRPMADTGDNEKRLLLCEWTLQTSNEAAHFGIYDLN